MNGRRDSGSALRAGAVSVFSAMLTTAGHLAGGGELPDLTGLVVLLPLLCLGLTGLADRCRGMLGTAGVLAFGQLALHHLLDLLHAGHAGAPVDARMLAMHGIATVLIAVTLRHADRAVAAVFAALRRVLPRRITPLPAVRPLAALVAPDHSVPALLARAFAACLVLRGPPVTC